jgi:Arc/MetJ-type ribon-helix-helix transcriptional regulator
MPSHLHEALIELFRQSPALAAEILVDALGVDVPPWQQARIESGDLTDLTPTEYRADAVVVLAAAEAPALAVVVEVQLRPDRGKRWTWPVYLSTLRARLRCPVVLMVLCADARTSAWCAAPIPLGHPGLVLVPLVLGPDQVPVITDGADLDHSAELIVLSAIAHGTHPDRDKVFTALLATLQSVDDEHEILYTDIVLAALPEAARKHLEELMSLGTYEYQSDFVRRHYGRGKAEGKAEEAAKAVLSILAARGIDVPAEIRSRVIDCKDLDQLDEWIRRAATADTIEDVFS